MKFRISFFFFQNITSRSTNLETLLDHKLVYGLGLDGLSIFTRVIIFYLGTHTCFSPLMLMLFQWFPLFFVDTDNT